MPSNSEKFAAELDRFIQTVEEVDLPELLRTVGLEILKRVIQKTPVDTGRARGSWQVLIGAAPTTETGVLDKTGSQALQAGLAVLANVKAFDVIYISNPVHYVVYLENGSSKQAPAGMVDVTLAEVTQLFGGNDGQ